MLVRRALSLGGAELEGRVIIRHEQFSNYRAAIDLMSQARAEADALMWQAEKERQAYLDQAMAEFWGKAGDFLEALEAERQRCRNDVIETCQELLNILVARLFEECTPKERTRILLEHLAATQVYPAGSATLSAHPTLVVEIQAWLKTSRYSALWHLREDNTLPVGAIRLSTDTGEYDVDWTCLQRAFEFARV